MFPKNISNKIKIANLAQLSQFPDKIVDSVWADWTASDVDMEHISSLQTLESDVVRRSQDQVMVRNTYDCLIVQVHRNTLDLVHLQLAQRPLRKESVGVIRMFFVVRNFLDFFVLDDYWRTFSFFTSARMNDTLWFVNLR